MRVGLVQFRSSRGPTARERLERLARRAAQDADLVVLPEMAVTGYLFPNRDAVAAVAETPDGPTFHSWSTVARTQGCWLVGGFAERDGDRLFNSALVLDPAGRLVFVYRKTLLYDADVPWATPGDSGYRAFDTDAGRFGVGICMDLNDDRFVGWCAAERLDALAFPTNWVESDDLGIHTWDYWAWRLDGIDTALLAANTWGVDGAVQFTGESVILHGRRAIAALPPTGNGVVRGRLSLR